MFRQPPKHLVPFVVAALALAGCSDGKDGRDGNDGAFVIDLSSLSDDELAALDVVSGITDVTISSPPEVTFTLATANGDPLIGLVPFWEDSNRYVRFTMAKLVPGTDGDPDSWDTYTRDATSNDPDYDTGTSIVDHGDGSYTFTFVTDVTSVTGVTYEPTLTHRLAGQLGSGSIPLEAQNFVFDFVPAGGAVSLTRSIAVMQTCNECHDNLVFHGRRFQVEYCVTCHNQDLAQGEGYFPFMIHTIHNAGEFDILDDGVSFAELTYPQDLENCLKCHNGADLETPQGDNWKNLPNANACFTCHEQDDHTGGPQADNQMCVECHPASSIEDAHTTANATPNNPNLLPGQFNITYELVDASVDGMTNEVTVNLKIFTDGTPIDVANLPADLAGPGRYPGMVLAWALPQGGIDEPIDYNNLGGRAGQPLSLGLDDFLPGGTVGTHSYDGGTGVNTFVVTDALSQFPPTATLRAVGLQGYFQQDIAGEIVPCHTPSAVVAVTGDDERRMVVDSGNCSNCHEWFEGHGGNRTLNIQICTLCHVPNLSSTGRTVTDPTDRGLDLDLAEAIANGTLDPSVDPNDPLTYPEDAQNLKDLVHGIHSEGFRDRRFQHVRGPTRQGYYDWEEVTFPRGASTSKCSLCHDGDTYELPVMEDVLPTTVRTTGEIDGNDGSNLDVENAFVNVPNDMDWVNTPNAAACFGCHTNRAAMAHMEVNGALLSIPNGTLWTNRDMLGTNLESCSVCHGPGRTADVRVVHGF